MPCLLQPPAPNFLSISCTQRVLSRAWTGQGMDLQVTGRGTAQAYKCSEDKYIGHEGCEGRGKMVQNKEGCQRLIIEERMLDYEVQNGTTGSFLLLISIYLSLLLSHQI